MEDSVFTKIIKGDLPANKVYEDDKTIAIIPLYPIALAHVLVIPKTQVDHFIDLSDDDYQAVMATVKKVGQRINEKIHPKRVGLKVEGLEVPHTHVHVVGFDTISQYREQPDQSLPPDAEKQAELAKLLAFE
jgi:histidine triad (HIT) family protein